MPRLAKTWTALSLACASAMALSACKDDAADQKEPAGELLPRSISDDMLPYDTVRSQSPLANPEAAASLSGGAGAPAADSTEAAEAAEEAAEEATAVEAAGPPPTRDAE